MDEKTSLDPDETHRGIGCLDAELFDSVPAISYAIKFCPSALWRGLDHNNFKLMGRSQPLLSTTFPVIVIIVLSAPHRDYIFFIFTPFYHEFLLCFFRISPLF